MIDLWNYLKNTSKPIVLYGMGNGADKILSVLDRYGVKVSGIFVSDGFVRQKTFHGFRIYDYSSARAEFGDMIVLLCFGTALSDVIGNIKRIASECELYAPDVAVYGDTLFNMEYAKANKKELEFVYERLADETSKLVFKNTVMYKLTGDIKYLFECETSPDEAFSEILKLCDSETYFDLGAYRGDTVNEFISHTNGYSKIVAVEPALKTFNKLQIATSGLKDIETINACISDRCGTVLFDKDASRGSSIGNGSEVAAITVDFLSESVNPTYIKMDIEGAELSAIKGAMQTIKQKRVKMQIAAYHRNEDLIAIPKEVLSIREDYKMYIRHFPSLPSWDMSFYFV